MPPRRSISPATLEELCVTEILNYLERELQFCHQVRRYQHNSLLLRRRAIDADALQAELSCHLDILPPLLNEIVRQQLTHRLLKNPAKTFINNPTIVVDLLDIVLNKDVKSLEFGDPRLRSDTEVWEVVLRRCSGLRRFALVSNMFGIKGGAAFQPFLRKLSFNCPMLTELVLKDSVRGAETLAAIGRCCNVLKYLDISGSQVNCSDLIHLCLRVPPSSGIYAQYDTLMAEVTEHDLNHLCQSLEVLMLCNTSVKSKGAAFALKVIPNLVSLGNFVYLAAGLTKLYGAKARPKPPPKLKVGFYHGPSQLKLKVLANCCPSLERLYVGSESLRRMHTSNFAVYRKLQSLTLENIHVDDIIQALMYLPQLTDLQISSAGIDVGLIGLHCPRLEKLCITGEPIKKPTVTPNTVLFLQLQELKLICASSIECAALLLTQAPKIRVVELVRIRDLTDAVLAKWLRWNPMTHLETLMVRYTELTRASVDLLLAQCPRLTRLGELGGWDIRSWECRRLKDLVLRENYALHLVLYSRNADSIIIDILTENTSSDDEIENIL
ncbi:uncharacterized protein [Anabrus simplex]|uniref:uncharacterized protein n=1 Tax=Anabrus simplex TaxID=316456 RepID=UPI0034DDBA96